MMKKKEEEEEEEDEEKNKINLQTAINEIYKKKNQIMDKMNVSY